MPYDQMTDTEWKTYQRLYSQPPRTTRGRAKRFILLAEKGWAATRAADDCFEAGDGRAVIGQILKTAALQPSLQRYLKEQGVWSKDWNELPEMLQQPSLF